MRPRCVLLSALAVAAAALAGCSRAGVGDFNPTLIPVKGKAVLADGKPAANVDLGFYPTVAGVNPVFARTDAAGLFTPADGQARDGIAAGTYRVSARPSAKSSTRVDKRLADEVTSGIEVTVKSGDAELLVTLK